MSEYAFRFEGLRIGYGRALMRPLSLAVRPGEFWGLVGPNGAGKSTLIKTVMGLIPPVEGKVDFGDAAPRFGYVPQRHHLNREHPFTVMEVALMGRYNAKSSWIFHSREDRSRVNGELERLGLADMKRRRISSLSGGQVQRLLIARALAADPKILILDEPTSGMDLPGESYILNFLRSLRDASDISIIMVAHHINQIASTADHVCLINKDTNMFMAGACGEMLRKEKLSELYNMEVNVGPAGARAGTSGAILE